MSIVLENEIPPEQRFTQHDGAEFHVFSTETSDATVVTHWVAVTHPFRVLLDQETVQRLKHKRLEWQFGEDKTIHAVEIKSESS